MITNCLLKFFLLIFLFFTVSFESLRASTYYFSSSYGDDSRSVVQAKSPLTPWKSLRKLSFFSTNLNPGDSILFNKGDTWTGVTLVPMCNGVVFSSYGTGQLPIIDGGTNLAVNVLNVFEYNLVFDGISFKRTGATDLVAEFGNVWFGTDGGIKNCTIKNCSFFGTVFLQGSYNLFQNNTVDGTANNGNGNGIWEFKQYCNHNVYSGNTISNFTLRGIWTMANTHDCVFENNIIHDCGLCGIDLDGAYHLVYGHTIRNNKIYNTSHDAIDLENAFDCNVNGNYMYGGGHSYIYVVNYEKCESFNGHGASNGLGAILNSTLSGNIMVGGGTDFSSVAIGIYKAGGINVYNNSVYDFKSRFFDLDYAAVSEVPMIKLVNNVFSTIETPSWYGMVNFSTDDATVLAQDDYNCFYDNGRNDIYANRSTSNQRNLEQYRAATGKGVHSVSVNPAFSSTNDLHLKSSSPCINAGTNVGLPYLGKAPDIGALEYQCLPITKPIIQWAEKQ